MRKAILRIVACLLILGFVNILVFYSHYFRYDSIPWDFQLTYYWFRYYWITALQEGIFPSWMPFQAYGYPFPLNPQTGLFYPPEWFFVLSGKVFTLHAAVVWYGLHVLIASVGAMTLGRCLDFGWLPSLALGLSYHFFGLFFSNASHVDNVKANVILPWLFVGVLLCQSESRRQRLLAYLILPFIFYTFVTGAYIGTIISTFLLFVLWFGVQSFQAWRQRVVPLRTVIMPGVLLGVGLLFCLPYLFPLFLFQDEFSRASDYVSFDKSFVTWHHLFTFFMPYVYYPYHLPHALMPNDVTMRPLFITAPLFFAVFLLKGEDLRRCGSLLAIFAFGLLMAMDSPFFRWVGAVFKPALLSRHPIADYRFFLSFPIAILGCFAFKRFCEEKFTLAEFVIRIGGLILLILLGLKLQHWREAFVSFEFKLTFLLVVAAFFSLIIAIQFGFIRRLATAWALFIALLIGDGYQYHTHQSITWTTEPSGALKWSKSDGNQVVRDYGSWQSSLISALRPIQQRPERLPTWPYLLGYREGIYSTDDYAGGTHFKNFSKVQDDPFLKDFMAKPGLLLGLSSTLAESELLAAMKSSQPMANILDFEHVSFRADAIIYAVKAQEPMWLVENEINFQGWTATLRDRNSRKTIVLTPVAGLPVRAWSVPAGDFELRVHYKQPWLWESILVAGMVVAVFLMLWLFLAASRAQWARKYL